MQPSESLITPDLARAARALAQVSAVYVAEHAHLDPELVQAFERHQGDLVAGEKVRLQKTLEECGVLFLPEEEGTGYGVRRKFAQAKVKRLETWENEGGPAYEDDV